MVRKLGVSAFLVLVCATIDAGATGGDGWPTLSHDGKRSGRSTGVGAISSAPSIAWKRNVGGALADDQVVTADVDGDGAKDVVMVSAGAIVARKANDAGIWKSENIGARRVVSIVDLDGQGPLEVIAVGASPVGLYVLNAQTGATLWSRPTGTIAIDALVIPASGSTGSRLYLAEQLELLTAYGFGSGITTPAQNQLWQSATKPWSVDMAAGDMDGDGKLELLRGHDRGVVVYDAATGAVRCDLQSLVTGTNAPMYFPAFSALDVDGDARAELVLYDYSYYYSEDAGVFVVSCNGTGTSLTAQVRWKEQWITDTTAGPGNDVNAKQIRYLGDGVVNLDGQGAFEIVYSLWDATSSTWTTAVRNAATGATLATKSGEVLEGVADIDANGKPELLLREATGIGALPKPYFSKLRGYAFAGTALTDKGWTLAAARAATVSARRYAQVTSGAGSVLARQNVNGAIDPAIEAYVFQQASNASVTDARPGSLLAVHGSDGLILFKYAFPEGITGSVLKLDSGVLTAAAVSESLVMLTDGGLRLLDNQLLEKSKLLPGNHARLVSVAALDGTHNRIFAVESSDRLVALDGTLLESSGEPVTSWSSKDVSQPESRGYLNAPGLVLPTTGGAARLVARAHSDASYEETALIALDAAGATAWKTDIGAGKQIAGFDNFEALDDLDADGAADFFLTELDVSSEQQLVVRKGTNGNALVVRAVGNLFPPSGVYLQGHAAADINADGKLDIVSALHGSWFVGIDVSKAGTGDPNQGFAQIFRTANGPNGQALFGQLDGDAELDIVRSASQNAFGPIERRSLAGVVEASYQPPTASISGTDANVAALLARPGTPGAFDVVWAGMSGNALGSLARIGGATLTESWLVHASAGVLHPKASPPAKRYALYDPITADLDGDGDDEILVGSDDGYLYAVDGAGGALVWSLALGAPVVHVIAADVDKDDKLELIASLANGTLVALDAAGAYGADTKPAPEGGTDGGAGTGGATATGGAAGADAGLGATGGGGTGGSASGGTSSGGAGTGGTSAGGSSSGGSSEDDSGCGCRLGGEGRSTGAILTALALAAALARRRKRPRGASAL